MPSREEAWSKRESSSMDWGSRKNGGQREEGEGVWERSLPGLSMDAKKVWEKRHPDGRRFRRFHPSGKRKGGR